MTVFWPRDRNRNNDESHQHHRPNSNGLSYACARGLHRRPRNESQRLCSRRSHCPDDNHRSRRRFRNYSAAPQECSNQTSKHSAPLARFPQHEPNNARIEYLFLFRILALGVVLEFQFEWCVEQKQIEAETDGHCNPRSTALALAA